MDIADFTLVIQWRAENLTMCSLMQRLGRAARNLSLQATFVLFAETKYFDRNRKLKMAKKKKKKSNTAGDQAQHPCNPSQSQIGSRSATEDADETSIPTIGNRSLEEFKAERKKVYSEHYRTCKLLLSQSGGKKSSTDVDPGVDDSINAKERGLHCRRKPADFTFDNDITGEY